VTKYIFKRILVSLVTVFVLVTIVFILVRLMPGDPFASEKLTETVRANLERYYGFDKPIIMQYFTYISNLLKGDLGYSMFYPNLTVNKIIQSAFPYSFDLGMRALSLSISLGLVLGITAALNRGKTLDFICVPVAQYQGLSYTILPSIALGFYTLALVSRVNRASMIEVIQQDYVKTAKSKGISKLRIIWKHQIRNAIMPVITVMGPIVAAVLTGTFVIESIFAIPGLGRHYVQSIQNLDYTVILGMTVFYGTFLVFANMIVDLLYGVIDPRIRVGGR